MSEDQSVALRATVALQEMVEKRIGIHIYQIPGGSYATVEFEGVYDDVKISTKENTHAGSNFFELILRGYEKFMRAANHGCAPMLSPPIEEPKRIGIDEAQF